MATWTEPIPFVISEPVVQAAEVTTGWATRRTPIPKRKVRINSISARNDSSVPCLVQIGYINVMDGTESLIPLKSGYILSQESSLVWTGALEVTCESIAAVFSDGIVAGDTLYLKGTYQMQVD